MEILIPHQDATPPLSPALSNPDMILPQHDTPVPSSPDNHHFSSKASNMEGVASSVKVALNGFFHGTSNLLPIRHDISPTGLSRPSLPGAWQTEEDFHATRVSPRSGTPPLRSSSNLEHEDIVEISDDTPLGDEHVNWNGDDSGYQRAGEELHRTIERNASISPNQMDLGDERRDARAILEEDEDDPTSHAALSMRAELILANAKKRLTEMEDNLNRARTLRTTASAPKIRDRELSTNWQLPSFSRNQEIDGWNITTKRQRRAKSPNSRVGNLGHSRVVSETSVPGELEKLKQSQNRLRASSAMGSTGNPNNHLDFDADHDTSEEPWNPLGRGLGLTGLHRRFLAPLHEDEPELIAAESSSPRDSSPFTDCSLRYGGRSSGLSNTTYYSTKQVNSAQLGRSRSSMQLRDLREQMQDLKGKVSSLRQRTHEDRLQRRSLQMLKTPSPFTEAPDWKEKEGERNEYGKGLYDKGVSNVEIKAPRDVSLKENPRNNASMENGADPVHDAEEDSEDTGSAYSQQVQEIIPSIPGTPDEPTQPVEIANTGQNEDSTVDGISDTSVYPRSEDTDLSSQSVPQRHEDRPDAFDYSNIFLHSGMRTFHDPSPERRRSPSLDSCDSGETTKAPTAPFDEESSTTSHIPIVIEGDSDNVPLHQQNGHHYRQASVDSLSTVATFATATENTNDLNPTKHNDNKMGQSASTNAKWQTTAEPPLRNVDEPDHVHQRKSSSGQLFYQANNSKNNNNSKDQLVQNGTYLRTSLLLPASSSSSFPLPPQNTSTTPQAPSTNLDLDGVGEMTNNTITKLNDPDKILVEALLKSLHTLCGDLSGCSSSGEGGRRYVGMVLRRRVDLARRVLDGLVEVDM